MSADRTEPDRLWHSGRLDFGRGGRQLPDCFHAVIRATERFLFIQRDCGLFPELGCRCSRIDRAKLAAAELRGEGVEARITYRWSAAGHAFVSDGSEWFRAWETGRAERVSPGGRSRSRPKPVHVVVACDAADLRALGLKATPTPAELKTAWRKVAARTHPDHGGSDAAFIAARSAYERLQAAV